MPLFIIIVSFYNWDSIKNMENVIENSSFIYILLNSKGDSSIYADAPDLKEGPGIKFYPLGSN